MRRPFPPNPHARNVLARDDGLAADIVGDVGEIDAGQLALLAGELQALIDGRVLHEAVVQDDARDARDDVDDLGAVLLGDVRRFLDQHRDQEHALVQDVVVLDELRQRERHALRRGGQEHGSAGQPGVAPVDGGLDQILFRLAQSCRARASTSLTPPRQVSIRNAIEAASSSGNQPPSSSLVELAAKKMQSMTRKKPLTANHDERRVAPLDRNQRRQQRGDRHQQRYGDAIGARERIRSAEAEHRAKRRGGEQPVHQRHIDLADRVAGGVVDVHARQEAELDRLLGQRKHAGDDRLRGDHGRDRGEGDQWVVQPSRARAG